MADLPRPQTGWPDPVPRTARRPAMAELVGTWRRSLMLWTDGLRDTNTDVTWVQGRSWYADLRQPANRPDFTGTHCLRDLTPRQLIWMAGQQAFAGRLAHDPADPACFTWGRIMDLEPSTGCPDTGWLHMENGTLVERGRLLPYLEHWHRDPRGAPAATGALCLRDQSSGRRGLLVRVDDTFAYARARPHPLVEAAVLPDIVAKADPRTAQDLLDCEVSVGRVTAGGWLIERSSLPFREGFRLDSPCGAGAGNGLRTSDVLPDGTPVSRGWDTVGGDGDPELFAALLVQ
ncbi:hypothetical protein ABT009_29100 [Streptomyces sp. NPDC002896]|uniref:hypothetical protein n=1 Tax=Streptomyces sp. NPDC002896 TaxID=3154438 RepID=UPI003317F948